MREALAELLDVLSLACVVFNSAEAFLIAQASGRFDCLVTDLHLPGMGGLELQRRLKALGSAMPVIVITSSLDPLSRSRSMQEGAFAYLTKPFSDRALIDRVKAALDARPGDGRR